MRPGVGDGTFRINPSDINDGWSGWRKPFCEATASMMVCWHCISNIGL